MIDLGESKKVKAVLKLFKLSFLEIIFTFLQSLIQRTQDKLVFWCDFDCLFTFLSPYVHLKNQGH